MSFVVNSVPTRLLSMNCITVGFLSVSLSESEQSYCAYYKYSTIHAHVKENV